MKKSKTWIVFRKELRESLRDRRTLGLLAMFTLMYPLLFGFVLNTQIKKATRSEREGIEVAVIGARQAPTLMAQLRDKNITVREVAPMDEPAIHELLRSQKTVALLRLSDKFGENYQAMRPAPIELWFDSASDNNPSRRDLEDLLRAYGSNVAGARLLAHGVSPAVLSPIKVQRYDVGTNASRSVNVIGSMLGFLLFPAFFCGMSAAVDSTAGERERRSLEVLMAQPVDAAQLIVGKWLAAGTLGVIGIVIGLVFGHVVFSWLPLEEIGLTWRVGLPSLALMVLTSIPLALLAAALQVAVAMNARSFKEAQTLVSLLMLVPIVPGFVVSMMELKTATWMYLVPSLANQTLLREVAKGADMGALPYLLTFSSAFVPAVVAALYASWRMRSERYVLAV
jgi:sodium transport system permease protein